MNYLKQFAVILGVCLLGEGLRWLLPLPIPASIYGLALMLLLLVSRLVKLEQVENAADFLIQIMTPMFIPAAVGLLDAWDVIRPNWLAYILITVISTFAVMFVSGRVTQAVIRRTRRKEESHE